MQQPDELLNENFCYSWRQVWTDVDALIEEIKKQEVGIEMVVGVSRGGMIPAAMFARQMGLPLVSIEVGEGLEQYGDTTCLVVDDIFDSGNTMMDLFKSGGRAHVYVCLYDKNLHPELGLPDYAIDLDTEEWIIFPWESEDNE